MLEGSITHDDATRPAKPGPVRTCAGCSKRAPARELVRVVVDEASGALAVDLADSRFGRGAHVHPSPDCLEKAVRSGFSRSFKAKVDATVESLAGQVVLGADRRIEGLLSGARRAKQVAVGGDVVVEALRDGSAELVVVARDAAAATKLPEVERAIAAGKAIAWGEKKQLGALFGRDEVAVAAVLDPGLAAAITGAYRVSRPFVGSEAWWSPEVR